MAAIGAPICRDSSEDRVIDHRVSPALTVYLVIRAVWPNVDVLAAEAGEPPVAGRGVGDKEDVVLVACVLPGSSGVVGAGAGLVDARGDGVLLGPDRPAVIVVAA